MNNDIKALDIQNLTKIYSGNIHALKGLSLTVAKGDFFALLGPNGAGKSTTIGILCSLVNKTTGSVNVFGYDLDTQLVDVKRQIGLVPQEFNFHPFEKVEQILVNQAGYYGVPYAVAKERAQRYLTQLELWEKRDTIARNLSGGMKRRLMIARALMHEPQLLILDEPTAGVDIEVRRTMWTFLKELNQQGVTIILTTHYLEEAEMLCRNIGIINNGELIENSSMKKLLSKLDKEIFILDLPKGSQVSQLDNVHWKQLDDHTLEIEIAKEETLNPIFKQLTEQGVSVLSMRNKTNRLEELFVNLTQEERN